MAFVVIYDACVLYPAPLRDLLLRLGAKGLVRARWTDEILDECFRNILINRPDLDAASLQRTRDLMNRAIPDVLVTGYEGLITGLDLPDADDRHVLAGESARVRRSSLQQTSTTSPLRIWSRMPSRRSTPTSSSSIRSIALLREAPVPARQYLAVWSAGSRAARKPGQPEYPHHPAV
jgi:hypothetical protein